MPLYFIFGNVLHRHSIDLGSKSWVAVGSSIIFLTFQKSRPPCHNSRLHCHKYKTKNNVLIFELWRSTYLLGLGLPYWGDISKVNLANVEHLMQLMNKHFSDLMEIFFPSCHLLLGSLNFWLSGPNLQQVDKIFPGGRKDIRPFSYCIKCSKLAGLTGLSVCIIKNHKTMIYDYFYWFVNSWFYDLR